MHILINYICDELEELEHKIERGGKLSASEVQYGDLLAHFKKNLIKGEESDGMSYYSRGYGSRSYDGDSMSNRSYDGGSSRYSGDGYYYDNGMSTRRGRAANGRFVSRDASELSRKLREMMEDAPNENFRSELQKLMDKVENM